MRFLPLAALAAVLLYLSLLPWTFDFTLPFHHPAWRTPASSGEIVDSVLNVLVYVPLGFLALRGMGSFWGAVLFGTLFSLGIEYLQVFLPGRDSSWRDVLLNSLGTLLGCAAARLPITLPALPRLPAAGVLCGALWFTAHCFPFLPVIRMSSVYKLQRTLSAPRWDGNAVLDAVAVAVILFMLLPRFWAAIALFAPLFIEALILGQQLQPSALLGALAGAALSFALPAPHAAVLLFSWLAMRQLQPFEWSAQTIPFRWMPFASLPDMPAAAYLRILILKLLLYTGTPLLARLAGMARLPAALCLLVLLAVSEALQTHLPGRTPESTDLVLAALGALLTAKMASEHPSASSPL